MKISRIFRELGGTDRDIRRSGPPERYRAKAFWRGGDAYNLTLDDARGTWYDFVYSRGGGILDLVIEVRGGIYPEALRWTAAVCGIPLRTQSPSERRQMAAIRTTAAGIARMCRLWAAAREHGLERMKAAAIQRDDMPELAWPARELYRLQSAKPAAVLTMFRDALRTDRADTLAWVQEGRDVERECQLLADLFTNAIPAADPRGCARIKNQTHIRVDPRGSAAKGFEREPYAA